MRRDALVYHVARRLQRENAKLRRRPDLSRAEVALIRGALLRAIDWTEASPLTPEERRVRARYRELFEKLSTKKRQRT